MSRILLDQIVPIGLKGFFPERHSVAHTSELGWQELTNGDLLNAAEQGGYDVLVSADRSIPHQQNLSGRRLALLVLPTNHWPALRANASAIVEAAVAIAPGAVRSLGFATPRG